jgi:hypothetical protein
MVYPAKGEPSPHWHHLRLDPLILVTSQEKGRICHPFGPSLGGHGRMAKAVQ